MSLPFLIVALVGPAPAAQDSYEVLVKKELARLQGTWLLVSTTQDGKPLPEEKVKKTTLVFTGDRFKFPGSAEQATSKEGSIKIDPTRAPKHIYATSEKGVVTSGIYEVEGD